MAVGGGETKVGDGPRKAEGPGPLKLGAKLRSMNFTFPESDGRPCLKDFYNKRKDTFYQTPVRAM